MNDITWHQKQLQMYNRILHTCKPSQSVAFMSMVVYHERMIHELNSKLTIGDCGVINATKENI
jgi:hypothetical protein